MQLKTIECRNAQGYPEILIMAGTETLATVHHLGRDRDKEWRRLAALFVASEDLLGAARAVLGTWEVGDLAGAVRALAQVVKKAEGQ